MNYFLALRVVEKILLKINNWVYEDLHIKEASVYPRQDNLECYQDTEAMLAKTTRHADRADLLICVDIRRRGVYVRHSNAINTCTKPSTTS